MKKALKQKSLHEENSIYIEETQIIERTWRYVFPEMAFYEYE